MKQSLFAAFLLIILASACTEYKPLNEIGLRGHDNQIYEFTTDLRESIKVPSNDQQGIKNLVDQYNGINIVFDGSNETDNARLQVVIFNIIAKLQTYYAYENHPFNHFNTDYYIGEQWYTSGGVVQSQPEFEGPVLWFKGPGSGAAETSVSLFGNTVFIQGTTGRGLEQAADKFVLIVFGVDKLE